MTRYGHDTNNSISNKIQGIAPRTYDRRHQMMQRRLLFLVIVGLIAVAPLWLFQPSSSSLTRRSADSNFGSTHRSDNGFNDDDDYGESSDDYIPRRRRPSRTGDVKHADRAYQTKKKQEEQETLSALETYRIQTVHNSPLLEYMTRNILPGDNENNNDDALSLSLPPLGDPVKFQRQHCDLQGTDWCPTGDKAWTISTPYLMIMGVKKAATTSLFYFLCQHNKIVPGKKKELLFFSRRRFNTTKYIASGDSKGNFSSSSSSSLNGKVLVETMREDLVEAFPKVRAMATGTGSQADGINGRQRTNVGRVVSLDATPQTLFDWPMVIRPILCGMPWIKLLIITRDPVDRLWSHYNFLRGAYNKLNQRLQSQGKKPIFKIPDSFEKWVLRDLEELANFGIIGAKSDIDHLTVPLSDDELKDAWDRYTFHSAEGHVGRGFVASGLFQWFKEIRNLGRDPKEAIRIIRLEDMKGDGDEPTQIFEELMEWLGLDPSDRRHTELLFQQRMQSALDDSNGRPVLSHHTRQLLEDFYRPYNWLLGQLLGDDRWDYSRVKKVGSHGAVVWPGEKAKSTSLDKVGTSKHLLFQPPSQDSISRVPCIGRSIDTLGQLSSSGEVNVELHNPFVTDGRDSSQILEPYRFQSKDSPVLEYLTRKLSDTETFTLGDSQVYQQQFCDLEGGEWCPTGVDAWQQNAPAFFVAGVKKSGTTSLFRFLAQHPQVIPGKQKELMFFNQRKFPYPKYIEDTDRDGVVTEREPGGKIKVQTIRHDLLELFQTDKIRGDSFNSSLTRRISFDATPQYLYNWASTSRAILCSCPWAKLLVIVRNPTDRLWSHYNYVNDLRIKQGRQAMSQSFENWLLDDLEHLHRHGLIEMNGEQQKQFETEEDIAKAWSAYTRETGEGPVGRNFYAFSLHGWFQELRRMGRDPKDSFRIVRLEDLSNDNKPGVATEIFNEIMTWLGLSTLENEVHASFEQKMKTDYAKLGMPTLSERTKKLLDDFHAPYNDALAKLLDHSGWQYKRAVDDDDEDDETSNRGHGTNKMLLSSQSVLVWPKNIDNGGDSTSFFYQGSTTRDICSSP